MPVLGKGGQLRLRREVPEPTVVRPGNVHAQTNSIYLRNPAFWSGDQVTLNCVNGLPLDTTESGNGPDCPDGHAMYLGSLWRVGPNRDHITTVNSAFYSQSNTDSFYVRPADCDYATQASYYIYRDQLDRVSFYRNRNDAFNGTLAARIPLYKVDFHALIVNATGRLEYNNAIADCAGDIGEYKFADAQDEVTLKSICEYPPYYDEPQPWITEYDNADLTPREYVNAGPTGVIWTIQADMQNWSLNLNAPEVDTTAVGERYGDAVKSIVNGGGTLDFFIDRRSPEGYSDSTTLLQLLLLLEKGCKTDAEFTVFSDRAQNDTYGIRPGDLYYTAEILITSSAVNVRPDEIIAGSVNFVTVGPVSLKMGAS